MITKKQATSFSARWQHHGRSGHLAETQCSYGDAEQLGRKRGEDRKDRAAHELDRAREPGDGTRRAIDELEKDAGGGGRSRGGRAVFMVVGQSGEARLRAPSRIGGPLNPGGPSSRTQITSLQMSRVKNSAHLRQTVRHKMLAGKRVG
jgi:hypothetical protein